MKRGRRNWGYGEGGEGEGGGGPGARTMVGGWGRFPQHLPCPMRHFLGAFLSCPALLPEPSAGGRGKGGTGGGRDEGRVGTGAEGRRGEREGD